MTELLTFMADHPWLTVTVMLTFGVTTIMIGVGVAIGRSKLN